jgi:hypothetical protein
MSWSRKSVYTDTTIILYFLCLTTKILLYYYCPKFPNGQPDFPNILILKKLGRGLTIPPPPNTPPPFATALSNLLFCALQSQYQFPVHLSSPSTK